MYSYLHTKHSLFTIHCFAKVLNLKFTVHYISYLNIVQLVPWQPNSIWRLLCCNPHAPTILCMLNLGHGELNMDGDYNRVRQYGAVKSVNHVFNALQPSGVTRGLS